MFYNYTSGWIQTLHIDPKRNSELIKQFSMDIHLDEDMKEYSDELNTIFEECRGLELMKYYKKHEVSTDELLKIFKRNCDRLREIDKKLDQVES